MATTVMITPSEVIEYLFCPRFTYFLNVLQIPQYEEKRYKVQKGRQKHRNKEQWNKGYVRKKLGALKTERSVYLGSETLGVRGIVDEVLWIKDGTMAVLDYKWSKSHDFVFKTHVIQMILYALLVEETYNARVNNAFLVYLKSGTQPVKIDITSQLRKKTYRIIEDIFAIIKKGRLPKRTRYTRRCIDCTYKNICV